MTETAEPTIYEKAFAESDKTDAILVVDGKKLHVNKALLSYHSDYFNVLFNSDFKEKSMKEIEIKDVNFENFATVLSLVHGAPIKYNAAQKKLESLLEIADRFQLSAAKRHIELFLITSENLLATQIEIADKYQLDDLMDFAVSRFKKNNYYQRVYDGVGYYNKPSLAFFGKFSDETNIKFLHHFLNICNRITEPPKTESSGMSVYEKTFFKTDKTDAILLVDGKKLHVNKAVLSHHSDYFKTLFNSEFKEKSMEEIPIEDLNFEEFATLLSMIHLNPIAPTVEDAVKILELSDRFLIPCVSYFLEPIIISSPLVSFEKIRIGEKYELPELFQKGIDTLKAEDFTDLPSNSTYQALLSTTKKKLFYKCLMLHA
ncbi:unnamed protein product [Caenorhabditis brenneri]